MLEFFFEIIIFIVFELLGNLIIKPILKVILKPIWRVFSIPIVDEFFERLAKISAIVLTIIIIYSCIQLLL